jgi:hypothetical protein
VKYVGAGTIVAFVAVQFRPASGKAPEAWYRATSRWRRGRSPEG